MILPKIKRISLKRLKQLERGSNTEKYQIWRNKVLERDEHRCQMRGCGATELLEIHHIRKFSKAPHLRYDTLNGITLCKKHHVEVTGVEERYEILLAQIALQNEKQKNTD